MTPLSSIIGQGIISPIGGNLAENCKGLYAEKPALPRRPTRFATELERPVFEIPGLEPEFSHTGGVSMQLLEIALQEALCASGLSAGDLCGRRVGVAIGTTVACQLNDIPFYAELRTGKMPGNAPFASYVDGSPAEYIRRKFKLDGPALTISNACASGADAIGIAHLWLSHGICDIAIAGGTDEINKVPYDGFNALGVCSDEPCRPFDKARTGLNLGEAAGVVIMAPGRSVNAECAIAGYGKTADAFHITQPAPDGAGLERAIRDAVSAGGASLEDISFINAHGTGTQANDQVEANVFGRMFGGCVPFMSTKAITGHTLGAAGAIEAIFTCIMLEKALAAKSQRFQEKPADFPIAPLTENLPLANPRFALSTSLAFGGSNSALLIQRIS